jgi:hypothetical protein
MKYIIFFKKKVKVQIHVLSRVCIKLYGRCPDVLQNLECRSKTKTSETGHGQSIPLQHVYTDPTNIKIYGVATLYIIETEWVS